MNNGKKIVTLWLPVIFWAGIIFYLSSLPNLRVTPDNFWDFVFRKLAHLTEYLVLYLLLYRATKKVWWSLAVCALYALSDELHQHLVLTRSGNGQDVLIDFLGGFMGLFLIRRIKK